jgi:hypothetical protein
VGDSESALVAEGGRIDYKVVMVEENSDHLAGGDLDVELSVAEVAKVGQA